MKPIDAAWNLLKANPRDQLFGGSPDNYAEFEEDRPPVDRFGPIHPSVLGLLRRRMGIDTMEPERGRYALRHLNPTMIGDAYPDMDIHGTDIEHVPTIYEGHRTDQMFEGYDGSLDGPALERYLEYERNRRGE